MITEKKSVALMSVLAAVFITGFKLIIGLLTGSLGILSEALHSALDMVAAMITYFSVRVSDKPADRDHNYGHGKVENLSAFIETLLLLVTCVWIIYEAVHRLVTGKTDIEVTVWSYIVVVSSIVIDFTRSRALYKVAKKHNSQALEADALHFSTDIWSSAVVLIGLICANFGFFFADSAAALVVAMIVLVICYQLGKRATDVLLDRMPEDSFGKVEEVLKKIPEIIRYHNLRIRESGADTFIDVNIHVCSELTNIQVHAICDKIEDEVRKVIKRADVFVHAEHEENKKFK